jgi:hypothetical protein
MIVDKEKATNAMRGGCWLLLGGKSYAPAPPDEELIRMGIITTGSRKLGDKARSGVAALRSIVGETRSTSRP